MEFLVSQGLSQSYNRAAPRHFQDAKITIHGILARIRPKLPSLIKTEISKNLLYIWAPQVALVLKNPPANAGDVRETGSIPGLGRSSGGGHGNPLQYSYLENPHGLRSLVGYSPQGRKESDMTEQLSTVQLCIWFYKFVLRTFTHLCCLIFVCFRSQSIY